MPRAKLDLVGSPDRSARRTAYLRGVSPASSELWSPSWHSAMEYSQCWHGCVYWLWLVSNGRTCRSRPPGTRLRDPGDTRNGYAGEPGSPRCVWRCFRGAWHPHSPRVRPRNAVLCLPALRPRQGWGSSDLVRLPEIGEAVVAVGYPHMARDAVISMTSSASVEWERSLSAGVGVVLDHQLERLERPMRGFPGFATDAPTPPGTSGGPVLDSSMKVVGFVSSSSAPSETHDGWNSFVALLGPTRTERA